MKRHQDRHQRRSIRLKDYDYSQPGAYYVTICTWKRRCVFGRIIDNRMLLNAYGRIVEREWIKTTRIRNNVDRDLFVIMPNHFHAIVNLNSRRGTARRAPTDVNNCHLYERFSNPIANSLPTIIRSFKSAVTKQINQVRKKTDHPIWQRGYYDHIVRTEDDLRKIREYILNNPLNWLLDRNNPANRI